jgi:nucleoside-diphosphate-sugar epimerase
MILVTGATGFLGGAITRALVRRGDDVRALVRSGSDVRELGALGVPCATGDVLVPATLRAALEGCDAVIHCAGLLGRAGARDEEYTRIHRGGIANVLAAARAAKVARVVHLSSPGILGPIAGPPATEDAPLHPTNPYERAKAAAEEAVHAFEAEHGPAAVMVRPEFVYGPGDLHVLRLFQAIRRRRFFFIGSGNAVCHPTYVSDAVDGILAALDRAPLGRTFHFAGPRPVTIRELAQAFARAMSVPPPRVHVPERLVRVAIAVLRRLPGLPLPIDESGVDFFTFDRRFSTQRAKDELGFVAKVDIGPGAEKTVAYYHSRRLLDR